MADKETPIETPIEPVFPSNVTIQGVQSTEASVVKQEGTGGPMGHLGH